MDLLTIIRRTVGLFGSFTVWACSATFAVGTNLLEDTKVSRVLMCSFSRRPLDRATVNLTRKSIRFILILYTLK